MRNFIQLANGENFDFDNVENSMERLGIKSIARALSNVGRFNGHTRRFYSVAQHSVFCSHLVAPEYAFEALMHDAHEALVGDMPTPLKRMLPDYQRLEKHVERVFRVHNGLPVETSAAVKEADLIMLATEKRDLMPGGGEWDILAGIEPTDRFHITPQDPVAAFEDFVYRYVELLA